MKKVRLLYLKYYVEKYLPELQLYYRKNERYLNVLFTSYTERFYFPRTLSL